MPCCDSLVKYLRAKFFSRQEPTLQTDLSKGVQQPINEIDKHSLFPAPSSIASSEDEDHNHAAALDIEVVHADFCHDDDDTVGAPNPLALACSRAIAPGDPPWPTQQEFEQSRVQGLSSPIIADSAIQSPV